MRYTILALLIAGTLSACMPYPTRVVCNDGSRSPSGHNWHLSEHQPVFANYEGDVYTPPGGTSCHINQEIPDVHS